MIKRKIFVAFAIFGLVAFSKPAEKEYTLSLTQPEIQLIYTLIDNAPLEGQYRKPLLQKISDQFNLQLKNDTLGGDSSKIKQLKKKSK